MNRDWYTGLQLGWHYTETDVGFGQWHQLWLLPFSGYGMLEARALAGYRVHTPAYPNIVNLEAGIGIGTLVPVRGNTMVQFTDSLFVVREGGSPGNPNLEADGEIDITYSARNMVYPLIHVAVEREFVLGRKAVLFARFNRSIGLVPVTALDIHTTGSQAAGTYSYSALYLGGNTDLSAGLRFRIH